jgi:UDP-N-acetylglucosamine:LPS N-acetylglucosamine transferase
MSNVVTFPRLGKRLLIVGSSMGAGHMTAAKALACATEQAGGQARVTDYLELPAGPQGRLTRGLYRGMVTKAPWIYESIMRAWMRQPRVWDYFASIGQRAYIRGLQRELSKYEPDMVVSTYNLAGQLLGRLRRAGRLEIPAIAYVTDAGAHPYWVAPGVDLHLAPLAATAERLRALGASPVQTVAPLVAPPSPLTTAQARQRLGLDPDERIALVNGGSWGVGAIEETARQVSRMGVTACVLCGNRSPLRQRIDVMPGCHAIGWTDEVPTWIKAADVVIDSAAGATGWETIVAERPLIVHKPLAGHGRLNAVTLRTAGLATVTCTGEELAAAVANPCTARSAQQIETCEAASLLIAAA